MAIVALVLILAAGYIRLVKFTVVVPDVAPEVVVNKKFPDIYVA
jgi:hypothetical protein